MIHSDPLSHHRQAFGGAEGIRVEMSEWRCADIDTNGEIVFAVGDVHGCASLLDALLDTLDSVPVKDDSTRRLVFLGDLISRGPNTVNALRRWAREAPMRGVARIDRLMGNHEQLFLLAAQKNWRSNRAYQLNLQTGGDRFLQELRAISGETHADLSIPLALRVLGPKIVDRLQHELKAYVAVGNLLFVHAGVHPCLSPAAFLSLPADSLPENGLHWAWIEAPFLTWRAGFGGKIVVHGHTPPRNHHELTHQKDTHALCYDRLGLDGGSAETGIVTAAQIEDRRYRVFRAGYNVGRHVRLPLRNRFLNA